jgi:hypothetical protein
MKMKTVLLGGAALVLFAGPALAQATTTTTTTTHHRAHHHAVMNSMDARIDALEAQIHELKAEEAHHAEMQAQMASSPAAQPQVSAAQFEALQNQVYEEQAAVKSTGTGWWDNTKVGGLVFFDLTNVSNKNAGVDNAQNGFHFDIKRFYLTVDHQFNETYSAHLTTDATFDTGQCNSPVTTVILPTVPPTATSSCASTGASTSSLYIKKAYLEGNYAPLFDVRLGSADMPWIPFAESVYGYRYVENTLVDRFKYGNSADWGVNLNGSTGDDFKFEYSVSAVNGAGYKKPAFGLGTNRADGMDFEGRVDVRWNGFVIAAGGYDGKLGKELTPDTTHHDYTRFDGIIGYAANGFNIGLEYFSEKNFDTITAAPPNPTDHGNGYSAFAAYKFTPEWAVFGRYDWAKPQDGTGLNPITLLPAFQPHYTNRYFNVGVQYSPAQMIDLSLVYKHDSGSNGVFTDQDGSIGGGFGAGSGHYDEVGLFGQFKF